MERVRHECEEGKDSHYVVEHMSEPGFAGWHLRHLGAWTIPITYCPYCADKLEPPPDAKIKVSRQKLEDLGAMTEELANLVAYGPSSKVAEKVEAIVKGWLANEAKTPEA